jgi:hypothetical protein
MVNGTVNHTQLNSLQSVCAAPVQPILAATTLNLAGGIFAFSSVKSVGSAKLLALLPKMAIGLAPNQPAPLPETMASGFVDTKRRQRGNESEAPAHNLATGLTGTSDSSDYGNWQKYGKYINSERLVSRPDPGWVWPARGDST